MVEHLKNYWKPFVLSSLAGMSILFSYVWMRSAATPLFTSFYSKDLLPLASFLMVITIFGVLLGYNKILTKYGIQKTFQICVYFFIAVFLGSYALIQANIALGAFILYIFRFIYIMVLIEQIWAYFNSANSIESAKILSGPMMGFVSIAPFFAGKILKYYAADIGTLNIILAATIILIPLSISMYFAHAAMDDTDFKNSKQKNESKKEQFNLGLKHLREKPVLIGLLMLVVMSQVVAETHSLRFYSVVADSGMGMDAQTAFYGDFDANVNLVASVFQFILAPLFLSVIPLGFIHLAIPFIHLGIAGWVLLVPSLTSIMVAQFAFKCIDYSLFKAAKEVTYVPLSRDVKYRTKQFIDVFGYRAANGAISGLMTVVKSIFRAPDVTYTFFAFGACVVWMFAGLFMRKELKIEAAQDEILKAKESLG